LLSLVEAARNVTTYDDEEDIVDNALGPPSSPVYAAELPRIQREVAGRGTTRCVTKDDDEEDSADDEPESRRQHAAEPPRILKELALKEPSNSPVRVHAKLAERTTYQRPRTLPILATGRRVTEARHRVVTAEVNPRRPGTRVASAEAPAAAAAGGGSPRGPASDKPSADSVFANTEEPQSWRRRCTPAPLRP
jgi:hypothetical protein